MVAPQTMRAAIVIYVSDRFECESKGGRNKLKGGVAGRRIILKPWSRRSTSSQWVLDRNVLGASIVARPHLSISVGKPESMRSIESQTSLMEEDPRHRSLSGKPPGPIARHPRFAAFHKKLAIQTRFGTRGPSPQTNPSS
jgi:hypothetical protein